MTDCEYVETVGVVCTTFSIDGFAKALGMNLQPLPEPLPGEPARSRPVGAKQGPAWVPWVLPEDVSAAEDGLYAHGQTNVCKALSLVPAAALEFFVVVLTQYLPGMSAIRDFDGEYRAISRPQIELLAARVSALNQCVY